MSRKPLQRKPLRKPSRKAEEAEKIALDAKKTRRRRKFPARDALPDLAPRVAAFELHSAEHSRRDALFLTLQECGRALRDATVRRPFYDLGTVAKAFGVSKSMVSEVYQCLARERLLSVARGSQTWLLPTAGFGRVVTARGAVGLVVSMLCHRVNPQYRSCILSLYHALRQRRYFPDILYVEAGLEAPDSYAERVKEWDAAICYGEPPKAREIGLALKDRGVRMITIGEEVVGAAGVNYAVMRSRAVKECLDGWKRADVSVVLARHQGLGRSPLQNDRVEELISAASVEQSGFRGRTSVEVSAWLEELAAGPAQGVAFVQAGIIPFLCERAPDALWSLEETRRVLIPYGTPHVDFTEMPPAPFDLVRVDWPVAAAQMADDFVEEREMTGKLWADYLPGRKAAA